MTGDVNAPLVFTGPRHAAWNSTHQRSCLPICLTNEVLWKGGKQGHHAFRLTDRESGRVLQGTLEIHTIELPRYTTISEADLKTASLLESGRR